MLIQKTPAIVRFEDLQKNGALLTSEEWKYVCSQSKNTRNYLLNHDDEQHCDKISYSVIFPKEKDNNCLFVIYEKKRQLIMLTLGSNDDEADVFDKMDSEMSSEYAKDNVTLGEGYFGVIHLAQVINRETEVPLGWCAVKIDTGARPITCPYPYIEGEVLDKLGRLHGSVTISKSEGSAEQSFNFFCQDLIEGNTLEKVIPALHKEFEEAKSLPEKERVLKKLFVISISLFAEIAQLHQNGYEHNDIKLENVMYNDETQTTKLIDFGQATLSSSSTMPPGSKKLDICNAAFLTWHMISPYLQILGESNSNFKKVYNELSLLLSFKDSEPAKWPELDDIQKTLISAQDKVVQPNLVLSEEKENTSQQFYNFFCSLFSYCESRNKPIEATPSSTEPFLQKP